MPSTAFHADFPLAYPNNAARKVAKSTNGLQSADALRAMRTGFMINWKAPSATAQAVRLYASAGKGADLVDYLLHGHIGRIDVHGIVGGTQRGRGAR